MASGDMAEMMVKYAKAYHKERTTESIKLNAHMNEYTGPAPSQKLVDAVVVDFINFMMYHGCGMDLALYTKDLEE
jgi:hypothetical protein